MAYDIFIFDPATAPTGAGLKDWLIDASGKPTDALTEAYRQAGGSLDGGSVALSFKWAEADAQRRRLREIAGNLGLGLYDYPTGLVEFPSASTVGRLLGEGATGAECRTRGL